MRRTRFNFFGVAMLKNDRDVISHIATYIPTEGIQAHLDSQHVPAETVPFDDVFASVRSFVRPKLQSLSPRIVDSAARNIEDDIIAELSEHFAQTLLAEFTARRPAGVMLLARLSDSIDVLDRTLYRQFVRSLWDGGLALLLQTYPVLARILSLIVAAKLDEAAEFVERLDSDWPALRDSFALTSSRVVTIRGSLSDRHNGLRTVKVVTFASGQSVVYKPKGTGLQVAWSALLDWANQRSDLDLKTLATVDRTTHGWVEFIRDTACADDSAVERFYRRAGALVCLSYAIRGSDCHFENVIASGEYPVLIDTETLMQPVVEIGGEVLSSGSPDFLMRHLRHCVMQSGMLPTWEPISETHAVNPSAFARMDSSSITKPEWCYMNSDYIYYGEPRRVTFSNSNFLRIGSHAVDATNYMDHIIRGFEEAYRLLLVHRDELLAESGPLALFRHQTTRFVLRNTRLYRMLIEHSLQPEHLKSEASFRSYFEGLIRQLPAQTYRWNPQIVWNAELAALTSLDIPMFTCGADSRTLHTERDTRIEGAICKSGYQAVRSVMQSLSEEDLRRQIALIRMSLRAPHAHEQQV